MPVRQVTPKRSSGIVPRGARVVAAALAVVLASASWVASTADTASASAPHRGPAARAVLLDAQPIYYLALGDSVPVWNGTSSYPNLLLAHFQASVPALQLVNLAVSGETTSSMMENGQYADALAFLEAHQGEVAFITLDVGGNDVLECGLNFDTKVSQCPEFPPMEANLATMLAGLRAAAPSVPIFGMTYYDPLLGDWLAGGTLAARTLANLPTLVALNHELTKLYGRKLTADVAGVFDVSNSKTLESSQWGIAPVDVVNSCQWLDIFCVAGGAEGFGDDPNVSGQVQIAGAFETIMGALPASFTCSKVSGNSSTTIRFSGCDSWRDLLKFATVDGSVLSSGSGSLVWSPGDLSTDVTLSATSPGKGGCPKNYVELDVSGAVVGGTTIAPHTGDAVSMRLCQGVQSLTLRLVAGTRAAL
jgi:hypothetical protein